MDCETLGKRPGILFIGSPNVGKRTLISRLIPVDFEDAPDRSSESLVYGWTINTKYYTADVSVWMVHLQDALSITSLPSIDRINALVMVFDVSDPLSFDALKDWISHNDIQKFDILLCIGNKVDLLPGHSAHIEYKRCLLKLGDTIVNPNFSECGISETEGISLLGDGEPSSNIKNSCLEWCLEHNIEYIEACASNADFDKCLSIDGDSQGVERLVGALSAHMWPGMLLRSGDKIHEPSLPDQADLSDEDSDYELQYEILSSGSGDPWDNVDGEWISADGPVSTSGTGIPSELYLDSLDRESGMSLLRGEHQPSTSSSQLPEELDTEAAPPLEGDESSEPDEGKIYDFKGLELLMGEIGNMRSNLRLMPDFQRREVAAKLAMKMAEMFGDSSGGEEGF
ncbi:uncharacterized protein LOC142505636 isoform X2 [Primulina tabacum]|uniref:uncharacterized protein LOC142505636 isoform X2 n=1 Tax=Primulina tabacum TaxID=48773 RepID=UPI003F5A2D80